MEFYILLFVVPFILTVKSECPNGTFSTSTNPNYCYLFQSTKISYHKAELECQRLGFGHLTSVHSMFENVILSEEAFSIFTDSASSDFWIGLNNLINSKTWSWMDNSTVDFEDWDKGQPQNLTGSNCGAIKIQGGQWISDDCYKMKPYVCLMKEKIQTTPSIPSSKTTPKQKTCPNGWNYFNETGFCYIVGKHKSWSMSSEMCKNNSAELASLHSLSESNFVANISYAIDDGTIDVWIGLFTKDNGTTWKWSDGTPFDFPNWGLNQPDRPGKENCGTIWHNGKINNWICSGVSKYVCKKLPS